MVALAVARNEEMLYTDVEWKPTKILRIGEAEHTHS